MTHRRRHETDCCFPGRYAEIRNIGRFLVSGYDAAELEDDARFQVELATDEAATNIIEHALVQKTSAISS